MDEVEKENGTTQSSGISVLGLLGVVFVTLKLCGVINWSWWWVTLPFWGGAAIVLTIAFICVIVAGIIKLLEK